MSFFDSVWLRLRHALVALLCLACLTLPSPGFGENLDDAGLRVRLGLIVNFARFVNWPEDVGPRSDGRWVFCFAGRKDRLLDAARMLDGDSLYDLPISVRSVERPENLDGCHIVYLSSDLNRPVATQLLGRGQARHQLTISNSPGFARRKGMVEIIVDGGRHQFDVDYGAVLDAGLKLDSGMLKLARRVY